MPSFALPLVVLFLVASSLASTPLSPRSIPPPLATHHASAHTRTSHFTIPRTSATRTPLHPLAFPPPAAIRLRTRTVLPTTATAQNSASLKQTPTRTFLLHVKHPLSRQARERLVAALPSLYRLGEYVPHNTYVLHSVRTDAHVLDVAEWWRLGVPYVLAVDPLLPSDKVHEVLLEKRKSSGVLHLHALTFPSSPHVVDEVQLAARLSSVAGTWVEVKRAGRHVVAVHVPRVPSGEAARAVVLAVAEEPAVHWVASRPAFETQNKFVRVVLQDNQPGAPDDSQLPLYAHGLRGQGQVVAVGDTGIDFDHCFFHDPDQLVSIGPNVTNFAHRKVVSYVVFEDSLPGDEKNGHGTHVAGTVAGSLLPEAAAARPDVAQYHGVADQARLAFFDMRGNVKELNLPDDMYNLFYGSARNMSGAYLMSNSWGAPQSTYGEVCYLTDLFSKDHPDFLAVFAAGNRGESGMFSLTTPGVAKNVLTVGSSKSSAESFYELGFAVDMSYSGLDVSGATHTVRIPISPAMFGPRLVNMNITAEVVHSDDRTACNPLDPEKYRGKVVLVYRGSCDFSEKALRVQAAGGIMMVLVDTTSGTAIVMGGEKDVELVTIPCVAIGRQAGATLWGTLQTGTHPVTVTVPLETPDPDLNEEHLSSFSSLGPCEDGRRKPDVVAPGEYVVSSRSDANLTSDQCPALLSSATLQLDGTSMATPAVAGVLALGRQYFTDGFFPTGSRVAENSMVPKGALLKAIAVHSARSLAGYRYSERGLPIARVAPVPSFEQGFGRVTLNDVLFFDDTSTHSLFVFQDDELSAYESAVYCFEVDESSPFKVTLVWTDEPALPAAEVKIVNNLDLHVVSAKGGHQWLGNGGTVLSANHFYSYSVWDTLNGVEQVVLDSEAREDYGRLFSVHVDATNVPGGGTQDYALIVTGTRGAITQLEASECAGSIVCPNECGGPLQGRCMSNGHCACLDGFTGSGCQWSPKPMRVSQPVVNGVGKWEERTTTTPFSWSFFYVDVTENMVTNGTVRPVSLVFLMTRTLPVGDPDLYVAYDRVPSLADHDWLANGCDSCVKPKPSQITLSASELRPGRYYIGTYGYCCDQSSLAVEVTLNQYGAPAPPQEVDRTPLGVAWTGVAILVAFVLAVAAAVAVAVYRDLRPHSQRGRATARAMAQHSAASPLRDLPDSPQSDDDSAEHSLANSLVDAIGHSSDFDMDDEDHVEDSKDTEQQGLRS